MIIDSFENEILSYTPAAKSIERTCEWTIVGSDFMAYSAIHFGSKHPLLPIFLG
jgi:hypothetical protein